MILDAQLLFMDAAAVTAAAASTNYVDLSVARDIGVGEDLYVFVSVDTALTDSGSNSVTDVYAWYDTTTTFTPDATQRLFTIPAVAAAGSIYYAKLSPMISTLYRYVELYFDPIGSDLTAGAFTAGIVKDIQRNIAYADGITIS